MAYVNNTHDCASRLLNRDFTLNWHAIIPQTEQRRNTLLLYCLQVNVVTGCANVILNVALPGYLLLFVMRGVSMVVWWLGCDGASSSADALRRFSSGDLQSECDEGEVDPYTGQPATTSQPKPQNQRPPAPGKQNIIIIIVIQLSEFHCWLLQSPSLWSNAIFIEQPLRASVLILIQSQSYFYFQITKILWQFQTLSIWCS